MDKRKVGIIGAGVSGLAACKHVIDKGFDPIVFEAEPDIGGVWAHTLESTRLQASTDAYRFSDFPWPADLADGACPSHDKVLEYIKAYAQQFNLVKCIRFNSRVMGMEYVGIDEEEMAAWETWAGNSKAFNSEKGEWHITVEDLKLGITEVFRMDFVIVCIGLYSGTPNIPDFPTKEGPEIFKGQVIHSMDYSNMYDDVALQFIKGKRVTVIGSGKSAFDIAAECARANGTEYPCTMVCRTKHWLVNDSQILGIDLGYFYLNRFSELLIHKPGQGFLSRLLPTCLSPLKWGISKVVETYFKSKIPLEKHGMVPEYSFGHAMSSCQIARLPEGFYDKVEEGSIVLKKSKSFTFCHDGVVLNGGDESIQSDLVIFATGFRGDQKLRNLFLSPWLQKLVAGSSNTTVSLYRECIHPRIPQLAVIGYSSSLTDMYVSERMSTWVAHFLAGSFQLPRIRKMEAGIQQWEKYKRRYNGKDFRSSCVSALNIWYNDILCQDMGQNPRRKKGFMAEWFEPYGPADYANM
ncbi:Flavin-containing monooxygenase [Rhynchospora pubera]|uniref:Flavin-containing monooxygenase n=1 Tax=Rhynchospora pubera TaxID=906938 RepID=A0AAV8E609_9POAL|nr:Flavin-containing monooxygenase [Rhynchospora pubera]